MLTYAIPSWRNFLIFTDIFRFLQIIAKVIYTKYTCTIDSNMQYLMNTVHIGHIKKFSKPPQAYRIIKIIPFFIVSLLWWNFVFHWWFFRFSFNTFYLNSYHKRVSLCLVVCSTWNILWFCKWNPNSSSFNIMRLKFIIAFLIFFQLVFSTLFVFTRVAWHIYLKTQSSAFVNYTIS